VVVIPEARGDVDVRIAPGDPRLPPLVPRRDGDRIVIDGGLRDRIAGCRAQNTPQSRAVNVRGVGWIGWDRLPVITLRVPLHARIGASGAAWGEVGPSDALDLAHGGCGDWTVAPVRGPFHLAVTGSGDTRARTSGPLDVAINGSGDLAMDHAEGDVNIAIRGSGDVHLAGVDGRLSSVTAGSGDIDVDGGHASALAVRIDGSGDLVFRGEAGSLAASVNGSGDVHVARVSGAVSKVVHGSGEVTVGR
ncbi:MAG: DUF2807 domain-containing protein, partial [Caulobacteraceae bacterium]|nr:DUF2807 domain-containing protein [Caulobacter sp.]